MQVPVDVATFLLNEKRNDILRIEHRFKVRITLIPNPHMETPHYSVTRLRLDDITAGHLQASYKLVATPEESTSAAAAQETKVAQRQQPAVRSITPAQPAPKHAEKVEKKTSLLGSLFGWLKSIGGESAPAKHAAPARSGRNAPRRERGERDRTEGGNRQRRERGEGNNKPRREETARQANTEKEPQQNRKERQPRPPRQENAESKPVLETRPIATAELEQDGAPSREGRKRGRRGGRRERERREQPIEAGNNGMLAAATPEVVREAVPARFAPSEYVAYPEGMARPLMPTEVVCYPTTKPVAAIVQPPVAAAITVAPSVSLDLKASGLTLIETDPNKAASVIVAATETREHAPRRRQRPREIYTMENSEPLQMVETRSPK